jgi:predicted porin
LEKFLMKKTLIALAAVAAVASTSAFAQSTVTLTGNVGTEYGRSVPAGDKAKMRNPDDAQNNLVFAGSEVLGGGLKASFFSEMRFSNIDGTTIGSVSPNGLMQNTYIALSGGFGSVMAGRWQTGSLSGFDAFGGYGADPRGDFGYSSSLGVRQNNVGYTTPKMAGFSANLTTGITGTTGSEYQYIALNYSMGPIGARLATERNSAAAGVATTRDSGLGLSYDFGVAKAMLAYSKYGTTNKTTSVGVHVPMGNATFKASYRSGDSATNKTYSDVIAVGVDYNLSKRTGLYFDIGSNDVSGTQTAYRAGIKHSF